MSGPVTLPEPRYVVRELQGFLTVSAHSRRAPGTTIWVADEWQNGKVLRLWHTEDYARAVELTMPKLRRKARAFMETLVGAA